MAESVNWLKVFDLRCRSKRGERLAPADLALCQRAYKLDPERYAALSHDVFVETAPFGSALRARRG